MRATGFAWFASALLVGNAFLGSSADAQAQGAEFRVNSFTSGAQRIVAIGSNSAGTFVVGWGSQGVPSQDGDTYAVVAQRYASNGSTLGGEFRVNTYTTGIQRAAAVAIDDNGSFVVTWHSNNQDGSFFGIYGQRYDSTGARLGSEFRVNTYTTRDQRFPSVTSQGSGKFVVVWEGYALNLGGYNFVYNIYGQRYDGSGAPNGGEFLVNTYTSDVRRYPSVADDGAGGFLVAWQAQTQEGTLNETGIYAQRYASSGARLGGEFRVNTFTPGNQSYSAVASFPGGGFIVAWQSVGPDSSGNAAMAQRFASTGAPLGTEFRANTYTTSDQARPAVAVDGSGGFLLVWDSYQGSANDSSSIYGQFFDAAGSPFGGEFRVNTYTTSNQITPQVAKGGSAGHFVATWHSSEQDGSSYGIFAQRLCPNLASVTVSVMGSTTVCPAGMAGTASVVESGGGTVMRQWGYRTMSGGSTTPIPATNQSYVINGANFPGIGIYYLVCFSTPDCGLPMFSNEVFVTVVDNPPVVTPPSAATTTQTLCQ